MSQFPAGVLGLNGKGNYYEVERQAESLFSMPAERFAEISANKHVTSGSVWVPPSSRKYSYGFVRCFPRKTKRPGISQPALRIRTVIW